MVLLAPRPNPYPVAAAVIRGLPDAMRTDRDTNSLTFAQQAKLVAVGADTLTRLDTGSTPTGSTILACLDYLAGDR